ncbi:MULTISPECIES: hypothetical protein [unclassified Streptomyces]|uniref:hypothetical protein n=1 Tax=unclassified Streptomyces TaxID=2593676 RepID=UPI002E1573F6|nr:MULTISPECIES: hypothetical protein [unclassified Streptomyces]WSR25833.1 hypothetical protein OG573_06585 [Streptomyces sp. NBC_01205]
MPAKPLAQPSNRRLLARVAAASLVLAAASPITLAHAASPSAGVSPTAVAPGGRVSLNIAGCGTKTGVASSSAFGEVRLTPGNLEASNLFGSATVNGNATAGAYSVTFECGGSGGQRVTVSLQVTPGAARGGLGGSVGVMSPGQIALGGALAAGGLGTGIWVLRRRSRMT